MKNYMISKLMCRSLIFLLFWLNAARTSKNSYENEVTCGKLSDPHNGNMRMSGNSPGSTATYYCNDGFTIRGQKGELAQRMDFACTKPSLTLQNGGVKLEYFNPKVLDSGIKISYFCNEGYFLEGSRSSLCSSEGRWSHEPPKCKEVTCAAPYPIINGEVIRTGTTTGSTAAYSCKAPMVLRGNTTRVCTVHGTWSGKLPRCLPEYETEEEFEEKQKRKKRTLLQKLGFTKPKVYNNTEANKECQIQASVLTVSYSMFNIYLVC